MTTTATSTDAAANTDTAGDVEAVLGLLRAVYTAWADSDADAFVARYLDHATATLPGSVRAGREQVRAAMAAGFAGPLRGSHVLDEPGPVRVIDGHTAIVVSRSAVVLAGEQQPPADRWVHATWTLVRAADGWWVAAYSNTPA